MAAPQQLLTARLHLAPPRLEDAPDLFAFMGDAEVMRHTYRQESMRSMRRHIAAHRCQARRLGFGPWTIRHAGEVIGFGGLNDDPFDPGYGPEIAYFFARDAWGKGFAGELVAASLALARARGLATVRAFAHPDNTASRRVLARAGFTVECFVPEMSRWLYRIAP